MSGLNASDKGGTPLKTPRTDWPTTARTPDNIQKVKECLAKNRRVAVRTIAEEVRIGRDLIVTQDLGKRKLCYRLVPHILRSEQMQLRLDACGDLTDMTDRDPNFLKPIVTGDETWCPRYDPEGKRHSIKWRGPGSPESKKAQSEKSCIKTMLAVFFDSEGLVHIELLPEGNMLNASTHMEILKRLLQWIKRDTKQGDWTLLHDNARLHTTFLLQKFLTKRRVLSLNHPPYSPDLSLLDFFLFPKLKSALKGQRFLYISDIQHNVTTQLKAIPKDSYAKSFQDLHSRSQKYITIDRNYFEEQ
ncbi:Mariner Mos1 transposase [Araneus ventricosus]|uniref:Mariner Mos1 transposase n=1 Tax=Araneus ventricosus TaxID=182803 RepID=A0A4Y2MHY9_ARAVE|nr:Mariner Mos1 transposase [Araneus ventricosus]